jgi:signal transduction histidine kinase
MLMVTIRDMSSWLELERQKNISSMKTIAFASAAHEFRNPLNGIITSLDLLKRKIDISAGNKYFTIARNCSSLMLFLVNDVLDYA